MITNPYAASGNGWKRMLLKSDGVGRRQRTIPKILNEKKSDTAVPLFQLIDQGIYKHYLSNTAIKFIFFPEVSLSAPLRIRHSPFIVN